MTEMLQGRLINERELAEWLGVSLHTVRRWRYQRPDPPGPPGPPVRHIGRSVRYSVADVEEWIDEQRDPYWQDD